jgi:hypothetical protein
MAVSNAFSWSSGLRLTLAIFVLLALWCCDDHLLERDEPVDPMIGRSCSATSTCPPHLHCLGGLCVERCAEDERVLVSDDGTSGFLMDKHEAALDSEGRACSAASSVYTAGLPTTGLSPEEAAYACRLAGKRLCEAEEWRRACRGASPGLYSLDLLERLCNLTHGETWGLLSNSNQFRECRSQDGVLQLFGNVGDMVAGGDVFGGDWTTPAEDVSCDMEPQRPEELTDVGFRCCGDLED